MTPIFESAKVFFKAHGPEILTSAAVVGVATTIYTTTRATVKACDIVHEYKNELAWDRIDHSEEVPLKPQDLIRLCWKAYIPVMTSAAITITCIVASNRISSVQTAAVAALYNVTDRAFSEYKEAAKEKLGEAATAEVRDTANEHIVQSDTPPEPGEVISTGYGSVLCKDSVSGRYFYSSADTIRRAENDINKRVLQDDIISLTEFYDILNIPETRISDAIGWDLESPLEVHITTSLTADDRPCLYVEYDVKPIANLYYAR